MLPTTRMRCPSTMRTKPQMLDEEVFSLMKNVLLTGRCWKSILYGLKNLRNLQSIALSADLGVDLRVAGQTGKQHKSKSKKTLKRC